MTEKDKSILIERRYHLQKDLARIRLYYESAYAVKIDGKEFSFRTTPVLEQECLRLIAEIDKQLGI